jgi:hypothetical protein
MVHFSVENIVIIVIFTGIFLFSIFLCCRRYFFERKNTLLRSIRASNEAIAHPFTDVTDDFMGCSVHSDIIQTQAVSSKSNDSCDYIPEPADAFHRKIVYTESVLFCE